LAYAWIAETQTVVCCASVPHCAGMAFDPPPDALNFATAQWSTPLPLVVVNDTDRNVWNSPLTQEPFGPMVMDPPPDGQKYDVPAKLGAVNALSEPTANTARHVRLNRTNFRFIFILQSHLVAHQVCRTCS
jgi:hypothetical protein